MSCFYHFCALGCNGVDPKIRYAPPNPPAGRCPCTPPGPWQPLDPGLSDLYSPTTFCNSHAWWMFRILARSCTQYYLWLWRFMTYSREILDAFPALTKMLTLPFSQVPFKDNSFKLSMIMTAIGLCPSKPFCGPWPYFRVTQQLGNVKLKVAFSWQIFLCSSCNFLCYYMPAADHACNTICDWHGRPVSMFVSIYWLIFV